MKTLPLHVTNFLAVCGRKGGLSKSAKKISAVRRNIVKARAALERAAKRSGGT